MLPKSVRHMHMADWQAATAKEQLEYARAHPEAGMAFASMDWSERMAVDLPDEVMSRHWHSGQVGFLPSYVHPPPASSSAGRP